MIVCDFRTLRSSALWLSWRASPIICLWPCGWLCPPEKKSLRPRPYCHREYKHNVYRHSAWRSYMHSTEGATGSDAWGIWGWTRKWGSDTGKDINRERRTSSSVWLNMKDCWTCSFSHPCWTETRQSYFKSIVHVAKWNPLLNPFTNLFFFFFFCLCYVSMFLPSGNVGIIGTVEYKY